MSKTAIIMPILFSISAFTAMPVLAPGTSGQPEHGQSGSVIGAPGARASDQVSMGPDPGGKTGDTVTSTTTRTGQPSFDAVDASNRSAASGSTAQEAAGDRTGTGPGRAATSGAQPSRP